MSATPSASRPPLEVWNELLDEIEQTMLRQRAAVDLGGVASAEDLVLQLPTNIAPMPREVADRVQVLLARNAELVRAAQAAADRIRPSMNGGSRRPAARPMRSQLDLRA